MDEANEPFFLSDLEVPPSDITFPSPGHTAFKFESSVRGAGARNIIYPVVSSISSVLAPPKFTKGDSNSLSIFLHLSHVTASYNVDCYSMVAGRGKCDKRKRRAEKIYEANNSPEDYSASRGGEDFNRNLRPFLT